MYQHWGYMYNNAGGTCTCDNTGGTHADIPETLLASWFTGTLLSGNIHTQDASSGREREGEKEGGRKGGRKEGREICNNTHVHRMPPHLNFLYS